MMQGKDLWGIVQWRRNRVASSSKGSSNAGEKQRSISTWSTKREVTRFFNNIKLNRGLNKVFKSLETVEMKKR